MKRIVSSIVVGGIVAGLLFVGTVRRAGRLGLVPKVHASDGCSVRSLNGAYGFYRTGTTPVGPLAAVGIATFDGAGVTTARQTIRKNGATTSDLFTDPALVGTYEVDPDCAGRGFLPDGSVFFHCVVVDGGKELIIISLSDANTVYGVLKKINRDED
jgi:hypothetical protein